MTHNEEFCFALKKQLERHPLIQSENNVIFGESPDVFGLPDSSFPRYEILLISEEGGEYISQREQQIELRYAVGGLLKTQTTRSTGEAMFDLTNFGNSTKALVFSLLDKKQNEGLRICDGFLYFSPYYQLKYEYELVEKINAFVLSFGAILQLPDTEV